MENAANALPAFVASSSKKARLAETPATTSAKGKGKARATVVNDDDDDDSDEEEEKEEMKPGGKEGDGSEHRYVLTVIRCCHPSPHGEF
jgi:hypothetical protein